MLSVQGTGNGGLGLSATDGAIVRADASTSVTGTGGDLQSGDLAATVWANLPQFDITAVGPGGATGSGTNVYPA
jgi:hypothetical protein